MNISYKEVMQAYKNSIDGVQDSIKTLKDNMLNLVDGKSALIEGDFEPFIVHYAETFIIPASIKEYTIKPYGCDEIKVLKAYVRN